MHNKGYYATEGHSSTNRKPAYDFLLVINTNWHPISHRFEIIAALKFCFKTCVAMKFVDDDDYYYYC